MNTLKLFVPTCYFLECLSLRFFRIKNSILGLMLLFWSWCLVNYWRCGSINNEQKFGDIQCIRFSSTTATHLLAVNRIPNIALAFPDFVDPIEVLRI